MLRIAPFPTARTARLLASVALLGMGFTNPWGFAGPATQPSSTAPSTRPASKPSTLPAITWSRQSPRDALKWFAAALRDGDVPRLRAVVLATVPAEGKMIEAMGDMAKSLALLHRSAESAYGLESAARFTDDTAANFDRTLARIDAAEVTMNGDVATVRYPESKDESFELHKVGKEWLIPAGQFTNGAPADAVDRRADELLSQAQVVKELAKEIAAGKYRTADAASSAWRGKMMAAVHLTTRPTAQRVE